MYCPILQDGNSSIAAEDSAAGNDLTTDATSESNGGEASGEASGGMKDEEEGLSTLPKEVRKERKTCIKTLASLLTTAMQTHKIICTTNSTQVFLVRFTFL